MVNNLHMKVTLEDIKKLFGNIGLLRTARMLGHGIAEVIFTNQNDSQPMNNYQPMHSINSMNSGRSAFY